jgi:integrase
MTQTLPDVVGSRRRGSGTQRQRRPGVWEVRVPTAPDPVTGRRRQRSVTVHGTETDADARRVLLLTTGPRTRPTALTVGDLLELWLEADHPWKPATVVSHRSVTRGLRADPLALLPAARLTPALVRAAMTRWAAAGATLSVVGGRFRVLRSALSWAWDERILAEHPLRGMRSPGRVPPRRPLPDESVRALIAAAETRVLEAHANHHPGDAGTGGRLRRAEQDLLLVRLAADTGARRGELAALRLTDLDGRVLTIERALSAGQLTTPKSGRARTLTVGCSTAELWHHLDRQWSARDGAPLGPWLFSPDLAHHHRLGAEALGHRFALVRDAAGVPDATLHRLRHSVATFLVARGEVLAAQARLGHADAATTLREYAHALPLTDGAVADAIDRHLLEDQTRAASEQDSRKGGGNDRAVTPRDPGSGW